MLVAYISQLQCVLSVQFKECLLAQKMEQWLCCLWKVCHYGRWFCHWGRGRYMWLLLAWFAFFSSFRLSFLSLARWRIFSSLWSCSSSLVSQMRMSSTMTSAPSMLAKISDLIAWKTSCAEQMPKGNLWKQHRIMGFIQVVYISRVWPFQCFHDLKFRVFI